MFKKNEREASHSSDSPRHPQVSFSSITDSPSCSFSNTYDVESFYRDRGSESDHASSSTNRQYATKKYQDHPLAEYSKETIDVTYTHEITMSHNDVMLYNFDDRKGTTTLKPTRNGTTLGHLSSSSFKTFLKSISPSGRRRHEIKKDVTTKSPAKFTDRKSNQPEQDIDKNMSKDKKFVIKKEFSFKSLSK